MGWSACGVEDIGETRCSSCELVLSAKDWSVSVVSLILFQCDVDRVVPVRS